MDGSCQELNYYIAGGINTDSTEVWVMVDAIPASGSTQIVMYYGSGSAVSNSNFTTTFPNAFVSSGNTTLSGVQTHDWFELQLGDTVFVANGVTLDISARNIIIDGHISGIGAGYQGGAAAYNTGNGPGGGGVSSATNAGSGGGAYGGDGGDGGADFFEILFGQEGPGGSTNGGATTVAIDQGSGGGGGSVAGGNGGGAVILTASCITITGDINMNGADAPAAGGAAHGGGGGSGGGVLMIANEMDVLGLYTAIGGAGSDGASDDDGGGGSGGRVKAFYDAKFTSGAFANVSGGPGGATTGDFIGETGDAGSIFVGTNTFLEVAISQGSEENNTELLDVDIVTSYSEDTTAGSCPGNYTLTRTWTATDACGNVDSAVQIVIVQDTVDPVISCPGNLTAVCDISEQVAYADLNAFIAAGGTASDNCDLDSASFTLLSEVSDNNTCPEVVTRTYQVADLCGNTATCVQTITINDAINPTLTCPGNLTAVCDITEQPAYADLDAFLAAGGATSDNCGIDSASFILLSEVSDNNTCPEVVTRTYQIADLCGNTITCVQTITINDAINPTLTCPGNLTAVCDITEQPAYADLDAFLAAGGATSDNCGIDSASFILLSEVSDNNTCPEVVTRTYQIADLCGNTITCVQTITINDAINPTLTCPGNLTAVCDITEQPAYADLDAFIAAGGTTGDNCGIDSASFILLSEVSDNNTCPEVVTRTYQIADLCGNTATCVQTITINDAINPTLTCPGNLTAVCDITEQPAYADLDAFIAAGGTTSDNCGIDSASFILLSEVSDNNTCPEVVTRTYQVADLCGNTATCVQTITINDAINPTLTCPGNLTAVCDITEQPAYADLDAFIAAGGSTSDNCGIDSASFILLSEVSDNNSCPEVVTRTYQIADLCGNTITCVQTITINDAVNPTLTCPGNLTAVCDITEQPAYADLDAFIAAGGSTSDNCGIDSASFILLSEVSDNNTCPEVVTRTYQIADLCDNTTTCVQTITINDAINPTLTCPGNLTAVCDITEQPAYADLDAFIASGGTTSDNCGIDSASFILLSEVSDNNTCPEVVTRTYQVADLCGNTATCVQTITINDAINPTLTCPGNLTAVCDITEQPAYVDLDAFIAAGGTTSDNCGIDSASFILLSEVSDNNTCPEVVTRTYQIADLCGNTIHVFKQSRSMMQ